MADVLPDEVGEHVGHPRRDPDAGHELEAVAVGYILGATKASAPRTRTVP